MGLFSQALFQIYNYNCGQNAKTQPCMHLTSWFPIFRCFNVLFWLFIIVGTIKLGCWFACVAEIIFLRIRTVLSWIMMVRECLRLLLRAFFGLGCWLLCWECSGERNVLLESNLMDNLSLCELGFDDLRLQLHNSRGDQSTRSTREPSLLASIWRSVPLLVWQMDKRAPFLDESGVLSVTTKMHS